MDTQGKSEHLAVELGRTSTALSMLVASSVPIWIVLDRYFGNLQTLLAPILDPIRIPIVLT